MSNKKYKKHLAKCRRENLSKGHSPKAIEKALIIYRYGLSFVNNLIRACKFKNILSITAPIFLALILSISIMFFMKPAIISYTVTAKALNFTDKIDLILNESGEYSWVLENKGVLTSLKLNGKAKTIGSAKVYLEHENSTYLIFDTEKLERYGLKEITAFAVKEDKIDVKIIGNVISAEQIINSLIDDINKTRNNAEIEIEIEGNKTKAKIDGNITAQQTFLIDSLMDILKNPEEKIKIKIKSEFHELEVPKEIIQNETLVNETVNITLTNQTENISLIINETINITIPQNITINITPSINETISNISINKSITVNLQYKEDTPYDENNDGTGDIYSVVDLAVENSKFNWEANRENLCTRWNVYSIDKEESTLVCYGSNKCCNFIGLLPVRQSWDEVFYLTYGQYGATLNNIVSAQVLYADYNLSLDNPFAEIYYSEWANLSVKFLEEFVEFKGICIQTCILPGLNATSYKLKFEINNSSLVLERISYQILSNETINRAPVLLKNISDISIFSGQNYIINLSEYFYDEDNDTLTFGFYNTSGIYVTISNETATLAPFNNFTGTEHMYFVANDSINTAFSNIFKVEVKERKRQGLKSLRQIIGLI